MILEIGKALLIKVTLERTMVFSNITFPLKDYCLLDSCCVCFFISSMQLLNIYVLDFFKTNSSFKSSVVRQLVRQLMYTMFIINNNASKTDLKCF